ncbi:MAG: iron-sulfur cluster assembly accessory protein [Planctomycetes bacterium]|nr:iron-sulfur cluster assembly accessory protein [Planctomycetota bacterium]NBO93100.1 iron-sulfur cluster assembly accessory protein [Planctomycetia bacterium]
MAIVLTEKAATKVKEIIKDGQASGQLPTEKLYLRLRVVGGGCSGFQHRLDLDPDVKEKRDEVFELNGVQVVVDKTSLLYMADAHVDYHDELHRSGFSITNPSAKSTCGCGSSFSM